MSYTKNAQKLLYWLTRYKITVQQLVARVPLVRQRGSVIKGAIVELLGEEGNFDFNIYDNDKFFGVAVLISNGEEFNVLESELAMDGEAETISFFIPENWLIVGIAFTTNGRGEEPEDRVYCIVRQGQSDDFFNQMQEDDNSSIVFESEGLVGITDFLDFFFTKADNFIYGASDYNNVANFSSNLDSGFYSLEFRDLDEQVLFSNPLDTPEVGGQQFIRQLHEINSFNFVRNADSLDSYAMEIVIYVDEYGEGAYGQLRYEQAFQNEDFKILLTDTGVDFSIISSARVFFNFAQRALNLKMINNGIEGDATSGFDIFQCYDELFDNRRTVDIPLNADNICVGIFDFNEVAGFRLRPKPLNDILYEVTLSIKNEGIEVYTETLIQNDIQDYLEFGGWYGDIDLSDGMTIEFTSLMFEPPA